MHRRFSQILIALAIAAPLLITLPSAASAAMLGGGGGTPPMTGSGVIVQVADSAHMAQVKAALESDGAIVTRTYRWNAYVVVPPVGASDSRFASDAHAITGVKYAQGDSIVHATATSPANDPQYPSQWGLPDIGAPAAWSVSQGAGVSVAVIDTGIDATQPDLAGQVVLYKNYVTPGASAADDEGHGTHVSGIIAAIRNNGIEGAGTAPKATLYAFKVLDSTGSGDDASVAAAIRDAVDLTPCRIISMSLGGDTGSQALASAVSYAQSKGAIVIAAAGNGNAAGVGVSTAEYPAAYSGVIGVGAVASNNTLASFSNYGTVDLDVVAPGVNILSTVPGTTMQSWSGTSMATPFVSGSAALVWSAHPELSATQLAAVLESTAKDLGTAGKDTTYGYGLVRPDLALASLATSTPSPTPTPNPTSTPEPTSTPNPTSTPDPTSTPEPTPSPVRSPVATAVSLYSSKTSVALNGTTTLSGWSRPGLLGDAIHVYVLSPGATKWSLKVVRRTMLASGNGAKWTYAFKATRRGTYKFRVWFFATSTRRSSVSRTLKLRVR